MHVFRPVGLKEAALDSPTFRATAVHFGEQIDLVEQWLQSYIKAASRLANEVTSIESLVNTYLSCTQPPSNISEAVIDHDYTVLALRRYNDGAKEFWQATVKWMKKVESQVVEPIKSFLGNDIANLKNLRRNLDIAQKAFDAAIARYVGQNKTKEASSLREDAFQLHEARKAYLKVSMDFCTTAPQVRAALDKLLIKVFAERWKEMRNSRAALSSSFQKWSADVDRIKGWSKEMDINEKIFKRELQMARKQIEEAAEAAVKPSRELDDYNVSTVPYLGATPTPQAPGSPRKPKVEKAEKQGWLFQRTVTGKPSRTVWIRRWFYVKNGIFGWLIQGARGVEESEKTGVLLCGVRPAFQEERRFCFEVKTKDTSIILQAETQRELMDWIGAFEVAKRKALENPASTDAIAAGSKSVDAAFAISPPVAPEFAAKSADTHEAREEVAVERSSTLGVENPVATRSSTDIGRKSVIVDRDTDNPTSRLIQKLDMHRKSAQGSNSPAGGGGIASLIASSHNALPLGVQGVSPGGYTPATPIVSTDLKALFGAHLPHSSLAPSTLAESPATTNLSKTAVVISGDRGLGLGSAASEGGTPGGLMANIWGTNNWGYLNRLERGEIEPSFERRRSLSQPPSPNKSNAISREPSPAAGRPEAASAERSPSPSRAATTGTRHRKTISASSDAPKLQQKIGPVEYPNYYPTALKAQDAQFNMLIPQHAPDDRLVMVFRAAWSATDQQEFPGRVYVTMKDIYLYSNHLGLVLTTGVGLSAIDEVTAAPGKDCDFLFFHLKEGKSQLGASRVTVKVFLEPLKLLQRRLNYLIRNAESDQPAPLEEVIKTLIKMENERTIEEEDESPLDESWEDVGGEASPIDAKSGRNFKTSLRIDDMLYPGQLRGANKPVTKFRLPNRPVEYAPQGFAAPIVEKDFDITAKALFHVLAGDKSAVFQILYCESCAEKLVQGPWTIPEGGYKRREFKFQITAGAKQYEVTDYQVIDVYNDHLCYVITDRKTPWFLPRSTDFTLLSKIVITHVAKAKCKFAIFAKIEWTKPPPMGQRLIDSRAGYELQACAYSLSEILTDQVTRLGSHGGSNSRKAVQIFGGIGQQTQASQLAASDLPPLPATLKRRKLRSRSMPALALSAARRSALAGLMSVLAVVLQVLTALQKVVTAHRILVLVLVLSAVSNVFFTQRDASTWWRERSAGNFLKRVGVSPNVVMGRSVWLKDLDEWTAGSFSSSSVLNETELGAGKNACQQEFGSILAQTNPSSDVSIDVDPSVSSGTRQTLARLQHSRQKFGTYRHDLLVALRVVDRVEKDMLQGEWESWVHSEASRCRQIKKVLNRENNDTESLKRWWDEYCRSCLEEARRLGINDWHWSYG